jgi:dTDP-glucose 4,6-dehydratase
MNLLVTGGAGFIGSHLVRHIIDRTQVKKLVNLDVLTYAGRLENLAGIHANHPKYVFEKVDIRDREEVIRCVRQHQITHVMHLAAESHVDRSIQDAAIFMETNVLGSQHLLDACRASWGTESDAHRFIQVSTDEVYGSLGPKDPPFTEESPLLPNSPYAASKAAADCLVRSYTKTYCFPAIITRCCNNYGANQHPEKLIPTVLACLREQRPIPVYGDGQQIREWIQVTDHVEALWQILHHGRAGEVYNIGSGVEFRNLELIEKLCEQWDAGESTPGLSSKDLIRFIADRPGHDARYAVSTSKLRNLIDWKPEIRGIQIALRDTRSIPGK